MSRKTPADEAEELRAATREAHEAMQGLRDVMRELRTLKGEVEEAAGRVFAERMEEQVAAGLEHYHSRISQAIEDTTEAVDRRFQTIADILLGEEKSQKRKGMETIAELAEKVADERRAAGS